MQPSDAVMDGRVSEAVFEHVLSRYSMEDDSEAIEGLADIMEDMAHDDPDIALRMSEMFDKGDVFPKDDVLAHIYRDMAEQKMMM